MEINFTKKELLTVIRDLVKYSDGCEHDEPDACCCWCQAKLIRDNYLFIQEIEKLE